ncbi:MAG TPA: GlsB/YeaQ/YmgE family stress response membrane protein [Acidimicrobiales bacterium]|jgi:uncharacterized membrane protein YeaQ/YmgE (transglycosylase-associated protein family)
MGILGWILVGLIAGLLARWVTKTDQLGCIATTAVGIIGALIGGALYQLATGKDSNTFDNFDIGSIAVAFLGSVLLLLILQALGRSSRRH